MARKLYYILFNMAYPCLALLEAKGLLGNIEAEDVLSGVILIKIEEYEEERFSRSITKSSTLKEFGTVLEMRDFENPHMSGLAHTPLHDCKDVYVVFRRLQGSGKSLKKGSVLRSLRERNPDKKFKEDKKPFKKATDCYLTITVTDGIVIYGKPLVYDSKIKIMSINPHSLPYYSPGALNPWFARLLVNIAGKEGGTLLDPFCGTASIPTWSPANFHVILCGDVSASHCRGGLSNYIYVHGYDEKINVVRWDYRHLPLRNDIAHAIVTDLPYGRSVRSMGSSENELSTTFFTTFYKYLRENGSAIVSTSEDLHRSYALSDKLLEKKCMMFVHNKLNRVILKFAKRSLDNAQQVDPSS